MFMVFRFLKLAILFEPELQTVYVRNLSDIVSY